MKKTVKGYIKIDSLSSKFCSPHVYNVEADIKSEEGFEPQLRDDFSSNLFAFIEEDIILTPGSVAIVDCGVTVDLSDEFRMRIDSCEELISYGIISNGFPIKNQRIFVYLTNITSERKVIARGNIIARLSVEPSYCIGVL